MDNEDTQLDVFLQAEYRDLLRGAAIQAAVRIAIAGFIAVVVFLNYGATVIVVGWFLCCLVFIPASATLSEYFADLRRRHR